MKIDRQTQSNLLLSLLWKTCNKTQLKAIFSHKSRRVMKNKVIDGELPSSLVCFVGAADYFVMQTIKVSESC